MAGETGERSLCARINGRRQRGVVNHGVVANLVRVALNAELCRRKAGEPLRIAAMGRVAL